MQGSVDHLHILNYPVRINSELVRLYSGGQLVSCGTFCISTYHSPCHHGCQYGWLGRLCLGIWITFRPLPKMLVSGGEIAPHQYAGDPGGSAEAEQLDTGPLQPGHHDKSLTT